MKLDSLRPPKGSRKKQKRAGRGPGSQLGKTAGRGQKGAGARSGKKQMVGFEGGQMPLQRRLPKRGFRNVFRKEYAIVSLEQLNRFEPESLVDPPRLQEARVIRRVGDGVKILANGEITRPLTVRVHKISRAAREKIEAAGGKVEMIPDEPSRT
ncbi:MAG: 50S ribosomal protein L15 [Deltaproteobacteria bacterium]|nr:MAG: 50S ribosomal protein L15 [Deltaproteobacteria bacterium]